MVTSFYFIDTGIIVGWCNTFDRLHDKCVELIKSLNPSSNYLLYSVQVEYRNKIQEIQDTFLNNVTPIFKSESTISIEDLQQNYPKNTRNENFDASIIHRLKSMKLEEISINDILAVVKGIYFELLNRYKKLTKSWIRKPSWYGYETVINTEDYKKFYELAKTCVHATDREHLALAMYIIKQRSRVDKPFNFIFFTTDKKWLKRNIEEILGFPCLKIELIE